MAMKVAIFVRSWNKMAWSRLYSLYEAAQTYIHASILSFTVDKPSY